MKNSKNIYGHNWGTSSPKADFNKLPFIPLSKENAEFDKLSYAKKKKLCQRGFLIIKGKILRGTN